MDKTDFAIERRLRELNPELHGRFTAAVFGLQYLLSRYQSVFPTYTDHTELHSLEVLEFCNALIGPVQMGRLNADEIYVLLMSCYLHDVGMGVTEKQYAEFSRQIDFGDYFETHSNPPLADVIRDFHHEFSGLFIEKLSTMLDIPSKEHLRAIVQVSRGHRKTDLYDEGEYPARWQVPGGNTVCLPYLAALIRLADEIDVVAARNPRLLYDLENITIYESIVEHSKHRAVRDLLVTDSALIMLLDHPDDFIYSRLEQLRDKMQRTLDQCRSVTADRTPFVITQREVVLRREGTP